MNIDVLETNVLHASDVIYWLDGTTGIDGTPAQMQRLDRALRITFENLPRDVNLLHKPGRTALWRRPQEPMIQGMASEEQRSRPETSVYDVSGRVEDDSGHYNPRRFTLTVGDGSGHVLVMYPTALGTRFGQAGGVQGSVRLALSGVPVPWALLELEVTPSLNNTMTFRAQADAKGDFLMPLRRLPPLPGSVSQYVARLSVRADLGASPEQPLNPSVLVDVAVGRPDADGFANEIEFPVVPGDIHLLRSHHQLHLAVQAIDNP